MERREVLKMMAASIGGSVALPPSVFAKMAEPFDPAQLGFFRPAQRAQVAMIAEAIIPKTDTPGAIEAGVPGWIEVIVKDCLEPLDQQIIIDGLAELTLRCQKEHGTTIDKLSAEDQVAFLTAMDRETKAQRRKAAKEHGWQPRTFLEQFKELTKFTFVSSELGATQALEYMLVPGKWDPAMPIKPGQKAWAIPS